MKHRAICTEIESEPKLHAETQPIAWDAVLYKDRNRIERMFGRLKINRAIATRYDKLADSFLGMLHLAAIRLWIKYVQFRRRWDAIS